MYLWIDVISACNLRCPSCPVGNSPEVNNPGGVMEPDFLRRILAKATFECSVTGVGLYNWTEPFLHPRLDKLVGVVNSFDVPCSLSTNLNRTQGMEAVLQAQPTCIYVSLSGFRQEVYGITHKGGNIEVVKENMIAMAEAKRRLESTTQLGVIFHRYRDNLEDELLCRAFCQEHGYDLLPAWAFMLPLEKVLAYSDSEDSRLTQEDNDLIERLAVPITEALEASQPYKQRPCALLHEQLTLNVRGDVQLCCAVYDSVKYGICNFLERPLDEIQRRRISNPTCTTCMDKGAHVYYTYGAPEFDAIGTRRRGDVPSATAAV